MVHIPTGVSLFFSAYVRDFYVRDDIMLEYEFYTGKTVINIIAI